MSGEKHAEKLEVVHFQRQPTSGAYSLEMIAEDLRASFPADLDISIFTCPYAGGILRRAWNMFDAWQHRGQVNHILGDVQYLAWSLPGRRTILTVHDCGTLARLKGLKRWVFWLLWFWGPTRRSRWLVAVSEFTREQLARTTGTPAKHIRTIPSPISSEFRKCERRSLVSVDRPRLLQVGTSPNKNLERMVEALEGLSVELTIIGHLRDEQLVHLEAHSITYRHVFDLSRADVCREYEKSDLVVFASTFEGFGMPIVEAQAVGRPVVTSRLDPMPGTAGGAASLVDPFDPADIRRGILRVLEDETYAKNLVEEGLRNAEAYRPDRVAAEYAALYRQVAEAS